MMNKKFEYKLSQTVNGKLRVKEGVILASDSSTAFLIISEKVVEFGSGFAAVVKPLIS